MGRDFYYRAATARNRYDPGADPLAGLRKGAGKPRGNRRRFGIRLGDALRSADPNLPAA